MEATAEPPLLVASTYVVVRFLLSLSVFSHSLFFQLQHISTLQDRLHGSGTDHGGQLVPVYSNTAVLQGQ